MRRWRERHDEQRGARSSRQEDHDEEHDNDRDDDEQRGRQRCGCCDRHRDRGARLRHHRDRRDEDGDDVRAADASAKVPHIICLGEECMGARQHGCRMIERSQKAGAWTASVRVRAKQLRLLTVNRSGSTVNR